MAPFSTLTKQFKQNQLALLSLVIAIVALSYNSWRNELSEENRNFRTAGFEILKESAQLQLVVDLSTYADKSIGYEPIQGWVRVNLIVSLSEILPESVQYQARVLKQVWSENWAKVESDENANRKISAANQAMVGSVKELIASLH